MIDGDLRLLNPGTTTSGWELLRVATENDGSFPSLLQAVAGRKNFTLDGPGYFVLEGRSGEVYARSVSLHATPDGSLVDDWGRAVLTTPTRRSDAAKTLVDPYGYTPQGRVCLAVFQAPDALRADDAILHATHASGPPRYVSPGEENVAVVREGPAQPDMRRLHAYLHDLWVSTGRASLEIAMAAAKDGLTRTALGLVK